MFHVALMLYACMPVTGLWEPSPLQHKTPQGYDQAPVACESSFRLVVLKSLMLIKKSLL